MGLRIRTTITFAAMLVAITLIVVASINVMSYTKVVEDADDILAAIEANGGHVPESGNVGALSSPEMPYETRYFTVTMTEDETSVSSSNTDKVAAVDASSAARYARQAVTQRIAHGFVEDYRFLVTPISGGGVTVTFLDCSKSLTHFREFLSSSMWVSMAGIVSLVVLSIALSSRMVRPMVESYEKQRRFVTDAGHELKTPLTIITADVDVIAMTSGESEWTRDIREQTERLAGLVDDLIRLARMEEQGDDLEMVSVDLGKVAGEEASHFHSVIETHHLGWEEGIDDGVTVRGDDKSLHRLVRILLDNATKYAAKGGTVSLKVYRSVRHGNVEVSNDVDGEMSREQVAHMFDRFYRVDDSRNSKTGGHGIGLSMAEAMVTAHGGRIRGTLSRDGKRLTISAGIPLMPREKKRSGWLNGMSRAEQSKDAMEGASSPSDGGIAGSSPSMRGDADGTGAPSSQKKEPADKN